MLRFTSSTLDPGSIKCEAAASKDFVCVDTLKGEFGDDAEPVVFLLGWAGSRDKHLARYSKIYEDAGCVTIRYTAPDEYIFFEQDKVRPLARKLLDLVEEMSLENSPVLVHSFSNGGCVVYQGRWPYASRVFSVLTSCDSQGHYRVAQHLVNLGLRFVHFVAMRLSNRTATVTLTDRPPAGGKFYKCVNKR